MKRFIALALVLVCGFIAYKAFAAQRFSKIVTVVARTDTATASTRTTGSIQLFKGQPEFKSLVGQIFVSGAVESTGTSALETTRVFLKTDKGGRTFTFDSVIGLSNAADSAWVSKIGTDTLLGDNLYLTYTLTDSFNTTHNVPITWHIRYDLIAR